MVPDVMFQSCNNKQIANKVEFHCKCSPVIGLDVLTFSIIFVKDTDLATEAEGMVTHSYTKWHKRVFVWQGEGERSCKVAMRTKKKEEGSGASDSPSLLDWL